MHWNTYTHKQEIQTQTTENDGLQNNSFHMEKKKITKQTTAEKQTVHIKGITKLYERWKYKVQKYAEEWTFSKFFDFIIVVSDNVDHPPARYPHYNP